jgi:hypothetical protein
MNPDFSAKHPATPLRDCSPYIQRLFDYTPSQRGDGDQGWQASMYVRRSFWLHLSANQGTTREAGPFNPTFCALWVRRGCNGSTFRCIGVDLDSFGRCSICRRHVRDYSAYAVSPRSHGFGPRPVPQQLVEQNKFEKDYRGHVCIWHGGFLEFWDALSK